ncbi:ATP-binding cassette domain-containing protein [Bifidobacterium favimelis]|uniref:ATP-binding cassette domain-containing protein n=1 Tax=Bifidobacterium favimelis TaxID=3122979 RepID=A0ABU8ZPF1_9BIFI
MSDDEEERDMTVDAAGEADAGQPEAGDAEADEPGFNVVIDQEITEEDDMEVADLAVSGDDEEVLVPGGYPVLSLKHVSASRKAHGHEEEVLSDLDLDFQLRRLYSVVTATAAQRAALMAIMTGLKAPSAGTVFFRGTDIRQIEASDYRGHQIGAVFGRDALREDLSPLDNLVYTMDACGRTFLGPKPNLARNLLEEVGFPDRLVETRVADLDAFDRELASVARAVCCECDVLITDEPTGRVEPGEWDTLLETLRKVSRKRDCAVIVLTSENGDDGSYDERFIVN